MSDNSKEIPIVVTYYTDSRIICQKEFGSFAHFGSILSYFDRNIKNSGSMQLKSKYFYNNKEIDENDLLINIIQPLSKSKRIISANLSIEVEEKNNISDKKKPIYSVILQPKLNPFGIYEFKPKKNIISLDQFPKNIEGQYELDTFNENSAYCNSPKELFISGGIFNQKEITNFWIINNDTLGIKKTNLKYPKSNHSMIYIEYKNSEFIFFAGGQDLKSFYYDINEDKFINWGNMNFYHFRPALIHIENYLYCFDTSFKNEVIFERTDLDDDRHKWEKILPNYENGKISNFTNSGFGVTMVGGGRIIFCGGDNVNLYTYLYDIKRNTIYINNKSEDILFTLSDKNFYKINSNYSVALPSSFDELKEVLVVDKSKSALKKINLNGKEDSKKNEFNFNNIDIDNSSPNTLIGNVDIVLKEEDIRDVNENMIDYKSESVFTYDNNFYFEKKYESNSISEEISEKFRNTQSNLTGNYDYIYNNDNFTNYKKERKNIYNLMPNSYIENDESNNNVKRSRYKNNKKSQKFFKINNNVVDDDDFLDAEGNNFFYDSNKNKYKDSRYINNYSLNNNKGINIEYKPNIMKNENNKKAQEKKEEIEPEKNIVINADNNYNEEQIIGNNEEYDQGYEEQNNENHNEFINEDNNGELNRNENENKNYEEEHMEQNNENDGLGDDIQGNEANNEQQNEENIIIQNDQYNEENKEEKENNNDEDNPENVQDASEEEIDLNKLKDQNNNEEPYKEQNDNNDEHYEEQNENNEEQYEEHHEEQYEEQEGQENEEQEEQQNIEQDGQENVEQDGQESKEQNDQQNEEQDDQQNEEQDDQQNVEQDDQQNVEQDDQQNEEQDDQQDKEQYDSNEEPNDEKYEEHNQVQNENQNENVEEEECEEESENNENNEEQYEDHTQNDEKENVEDSKDGEFEESNEDNNNEENIGEDGAFKEADDDNHEENVEEEENNDENQENINGDNNKEGKEEENKNRMEEEQEQEQGQGQNSDENIEDENLNDKDNYEHQERDKFEQTIIQSLGEDIIQIDTHPNYYYYDENNFCDYLHEVEEMML